MGTRIDVRPDAFYEAAQSLDGTVLAAADGALDRLCATLDSCAAMAGSDPGGVAWADQYDRAARVAVRAGTDLSNAMYRLVQLLEQTGVNHERADAASTVGGLRAATRAGAYLHGSYEFTHPDPPTAAGGSNSPPTGWSLVESAVGYVWPNGHQDRLDAAGDAWAAAATAYDSAADAMFPVWAEIAVQHSPEVNDAGLICDGVANHLRQLAHACSSLAQACYTLAHHIDVVHSEVEHELVGIGVQSFAIEGLGAVVSAFSFGTAEAPTQAVEASRIAATAARIGELIKDFVATVKAIAEALPALSEICENVSLAVAKLRNLRIVVVDVEGVPGFRTVMITSRAARGGQAITSTEMAGEVRATEGLAREVGDSRAQWTRLSKSLRKAASGRGNFGLGKATRGESDAAGRAWVGRDARVAKDGKTLISRDGLRQYRPPIYKSRIGKWQANLERRARPSGAWLHNGHFDIVEKP